jgi:transcriptional regulator with XRE-family HTH domain
MDDNELIEGEIIEPEDERRPGPVGDVADQFWNELVLPPRRFGDVLDHLREAISAQLKERITQERLGDLLGGVDQVTVGRWMRGEQRPQKEALLKIVALAQQFGMTNVTLASLRQSLAIESDEYLALDPRVRRLDVLLSRESEAFRVEFFEVIYAIYHLLRGDTRKGL